MVGLATAIKMAVVWLTRVVGSERGARGRGEEVLELLMIGSFPLYLLWISFNHLHHVSRYIIDLYPLEISVIRTICHQRR